jgi:hypothetical protein
VIGGQIQVLDYITWEAFNIHYEEALQQSSRAPSDFWFEVAEWGFHVGRQDCDVYLNYMFRMNREKQRDDGIIAGVSAASSAIVAATTHNPVKALSVLAASFGLATALNDAIFESYLFSEAPGLISIKVKGLQDAYQQQVEKNQNPKQSGTVTTSSTTTTTQTTVTQAGTNSTAKTTPPDTSTAVVIPILSPEQAYNAIQNYYNICLPQSIEGVLLQAVADSSAKPSSPSTSSTPKLQAAK